MKRIPAILGTALAALLASCSPGTSPATGIIPAPAEVRLLRGGFALPDTLRYTAALDTDGRQTLAAWAPAAPIPLAEGGADAPLRIRLDTSLRAEGYRLAIAPKRIEIAAADPAGAFYALQSLFQLADRFGRTIPAFVIEDAPRFAYRGLMLDVSRHFRSKEFVMRQLDLMARYKLNRFHWHLTDCAGWRIEIDRYPELTDIAAWRPYPHWDAWQTGGHRYCRRDDPRAEGGYYTKEEIREVVEYARLRHITVIPEIEMPGHSEEVVSVYPELSCLGRPHSSRDLCIGNERTFGFLCDVLDEVIGLFPSEYIHIGGDEATKRTWPSCPKCRARMEREGLADADELQSYLIRRIGRHLESRGRRLLGWDEILQGGPIPDAAVMSWRGTEGGIAAAADGHRVVMSPTAYCYLDFCQDDPTLEPPAMGAFLTLPTAYSYDPAPDSLPDEVASMILGVQGNLWCERVRTDGHCEHMLWPRALAVAEAGWSLPERKDYDDFLARTLDAVAWMQAHGYRPFDQKRAVGTRAESRTPVACLSTGRPVAYLTPNDPRYDAAGSGSLTDGVRGDWDYADGRWQGWLDSDADLVVDLGERRPLRYIGADFMQGYTADIWLPREVEISVSDDSVRFEPLAAVGHDVPVEFRQGVYRTFAWEGEAAGRYVRLTARHNGRRGGWIFTDEIVVR